MSGKRITGKQDAGPYGGKRPAPHSLGQGVMVSYPRRRTPLGKGCAAAHPSEAGRLDVAGGLFKRSGLLYP